MRNILLTIAIVLAAGINGILAYDISLRSGKDKEIVVAANTSPTTIKPIVEPVEPIVEPVAKVPVETDPINILIVPTTPEVYYPIYTRWEYHRFQPVRNLVRFFHNRWGRC